MAKRKRKVVRTERPHQGVWRRVYDDGSKDPRFFISVNQQVDGKQKRHNLPAFTDAKRSNRLRQHVLVALETRDAGEAVNTKQLSKRAVEILEKLGIVKTKRRSELSDLIEEYRGVLQARNCSVEHVKTACTRITWIIEDCGWSRPADIEAGPVETYLHRCRTRKKAPISIATSNHYREALLAFVSWLMDEELLDRNPLRKL